MNGTTAGFSTVHTVELAAVLREVTAARAAVNAAQARETRALASAESLVRRMVSDSPRAVQERDMTRRAVAAEIAVPLRLADRSVQSKMGDAAVLVEDYPVTMAAWEAGRIDRGHVHAIDKAGASLPPEARAAFDAQAAVLCETTSTVRTKEILERLADRIHPRTPTERHRDARENRRVWVEGLGDGMSLLCAQLPTILAEGVKDRLDQQTTALVDLRKQAKTRIRDDRAAGVPEHELDPGDCTLAEDTRTVDQIRADILADQLLTGQVTTDPTALQDGTGELGAIRAHVQVVVQATTLLGADEHSADLVGVAPVDADTARQLAGNCPGLDRLLTHPVTGQLLAVDRYSPGPDLRRMLKARDRHCRFPGCRVPALRCEIDHTHDFALGGPTCLSNLACLCQRHHSMKQFTPWRVRQLGDGILEWTSPTGQVYIDEPPTPWFVMAPDDGSPPPF